MQNLLTPDPVALHAHLRPQQLACLEFASGRRWTYAEFDQAIERTVAALTKGFGIEPGQRVAAIAHNCAETVLLQQACMRIGAMLAPLNWRLSAVELEAILADCSPSLVLRGDKVPAPATPPGAISIGVAEMAAAIDAAAPGARLAPAPADRPAVLLYTSGTSGKPKGVILTAQNLLATAINFGVLGEVSPESVFLCDAPMFHVIGAVTTIQSPFLRGGSILISSSFDAVATNLRLADESLRVTHYFCVPQMAESLRYAPHFEPEKWRLKALFTGGAPNPPASIRWWLSQGVKMVDGYGMTENGTVLGMPLNAELIAPKAGSVGFAGPATWVRLVDDAGADVGDDTPGELLVFGPNVTPGYWNRPEETARTFTADGWLRTGDIARRDKDGFIFIVDRRKDMFISGGENVYPIEIEAVLVEHEAVLEAAVVGVPDERWGEVGRAYIVPKSGCEISVEELAAHCETRLARYKLPKEFRVVEALPRTASGKIQKNTLRAEA